jgi:hypothetical protein
MQYIRELDGLPTEELTAYLRECKAPFEASAVYEVATEAKRVDPDLRTSEFRAMRDPGLFDIAARLVERISAADDMVSFSLVRSDVTHLKYSPGGFFRAHKDFLSFTSNCLQVWPACVWGGGL